MAEAFNTFISAWLGPVLIGAMVLVGLRYFRNMTPVPVNPIVLFGLVFMTAWGALFAYNMGAIMPALQAMMSN